MVSFIPVYHPFPLVTTIVFARARTLTDASILSRPQRRTARDANREPPAAAVEA